MLALLQPEHLIAAVGLVGVIAIIFAESGLFFGFFLPGDSLLFTAGLFASQGLLNIFWLVIGCALAAIIGDSVGYAFGKRVGPALFSREDSFFFHKKHVERAHRFYEKYGKKAIVLARFVPIVRTFAPIVAGVGEMPYKTFVSFNVIGGVLWTIVVSLAGYFLGQAFPATERYLSYIIVIVVALSVVPIALELFREWRARRSV
ncbi:MAG: VTT domain-containing protein [Patescibacteria group bacterium]|nr:VTT domain-containing protein [Patescibacteria group bacterium]MDE2116572.1 VTT domain-containing protein [Patescibacteria group bacterium]